MRSPPGRVSRLFSHPRGEGGTGISPALPPLVDVSLAGREAGSAGGTASPARRRQVPRGRGRQCLAGWARLPWRRRGRPRVLGERRGGRISAELRGILPPRKKARGGTGTRRGLNCARVEQHPRRRRVLLQERQVLAGECVTRLKHPNQTSQPTATATKTRRNKKTKHKNSTVQHNSSNKNQSVTQTAWKSGVGILEFASFRPLGPGIH